MGVSDLNKIAFFGPAASGKTWCANYLIGEYHYKRVAFADKVKEIGKDLFNVYTKNGDDRRILQGIGQGMRQIRPTVWIDYLLDTVKSYEGTAWEPVRLVLDDLRYQNEADALRDAGFALVMVAAPSALLDQRRAALYPDTPLSAYYHASEQEWTGIVPDYTVQSIDDSAIDEIEKFLGQKLRSF